MPIDNSGPGGVTRSGGIRKVNPTGTGDSQVGSPDGLVYYDTVNDATSLVVGSSRYRLIDGETASAQGVAFSLANGFTAGSTATAGQISTTYVDTSGAIVDLADDSFLVPSNATVAKCSALVTFAANATGRRYVAVEQYFQVITTWVPITGFNLEVLALATNATTVNLNVPYFPLNPTSFPKLRIAVGQSSGGALNCTIAGVTFEFMVV
jgi:hypothetical protein